MLGYRQGQNTWAARFERGEVRDPSPYCYHLAADIYDLAWSQDRPEGALRSMTRRAILWLAGTDLIHVWRNRGLLHWADVVWTHTEREHLAVSLYLNVLRPARRPKILAQTVWLWDAWSRCGRTRRAWYGRLLSCLDIEAVHSDLNLKLARAQDPSRTVVRVPFGASGPDPTPQPEHGYVLALGNDIHRDWALLARTAEILPGTEFVVASPDPAAYGRDWPSNVRCTTAINVREVDDLYRGAALVVLPLKPNLHASGATVAIEAASSGRPVLATNTGGLDAYVVSLGGTLTTADGSLALAEAIREELTRIAQGGAPDMRRPASAGLSPTDYVSRYIWLTEMLLGRRSWDERVGELQSMAWARSGDGAPAPDSGNEPRA